MKRYIFSLILLVLNISLCVAQFDYGITIDMGKNHQADSARVTHFSIGFSNYTDTLKGLQLNAISNYAYSTNGVQLTGFFKHLVVATEGFTVKWRNKHSDGRG